MTQAFNWIFDMTGPVRDAITTAVLTVWNYFYTLLVSWMATIFPWEKLKDFAWKGFIKVGKAAKEFLPEDLADLLETSVQYLNSVEFGKGMAAAFYLATPMGHKWVIIACFTVAMSVWAVTSLVKFVVWIKTLVWASA